MVTIIRNKLYVYKPTCVHELYSIVHTLDSVVYWSSGVARVARVACKWEKNEYADITSENCTIDNTVCIIYDCTDFINCE